MTSMTAPTAPTSTPARRGWRRPTSDVRLAAEPAATYDYDSGTCAGAQAIRDAVAEVEAAVARLQQLVGPVSGGGGAPGDLGALTDLLAVADRVQATTVALADRVLTDRRAPQATGLGLEGALALATPTLHGERRRLAGLAEALRHRPVLAALWHRGRISTATVVAIVSETSQLSSGQQREVDQTLLSPADTAAEEPVDADGLVEHIRDQVDRLQPARAERDEVRRFERRFVAVQPGFDGSLSFYGELDPEGGATFLEALQTAAPRPVLTDADTTTNADTPDATEEELAEAAEQPLGDPMRSLATRSRGRQLADGLVALAEQYLAGDAGRRPRPRLYVWADINTLVGDDASAASGRALAAAVTGRWALTPSATRRLASDARLQFILADGTDVLGVSAPTDTIPARVRAAVTARDQGCRFPRCRAPIHWCDLHHVQPRERGGPTVVSNLVALCRRHHTAVTQGRWQLAMTGAGIVTVRRGRRRATSHPPPADPDPTAPSGSGGSDPPG